MRAISSVSAGGVLVEDEVSTGSGSDRVWCSSPTVREGVIVNALAYARATAATRSLPLPVVTPLRQRRHPAPRLR